MSATTRIARPEMRIDLDAVAENARTFRARSRGLMAVVKADAFGHGDIAAHLLAHGADRLGTTSLDEAIALRARTGARTLAWLTSPAADFDDAVRTGVDVAVPSLAHLRSLVAAARRVGRPARVHLHIDLGMARDGAPREAWRELSWFAAAMVRAGIVEPAGIMGHLSHAATPDDAHNQAQQLLFDNAVNAAARQGFRAEVRHLAATGAALRGTGTGYELVRVGAGLYGIDPAGSRPLAQAIRLDAPVVMVRDIPAGAGVGYDHSWIADRPTRIATIAVGYADGIPRSSSGRAEVLVGGARARVVGTVSMDQATLDIGHLPVQAGDAATLVGSSDGAPSFADWARWSGTIPHDLVTGLGRRWHRSYVGGAA